MKKAGQGQGQRSFVGENILAYSATQELNKFRSTRKKMCWKCQKDKTQHGGLAHTIDGFGGSVHKFICKDCLDIKEKAKHAKTQTTRATEVQKHTDVGQAVDDP